MTDCLPLVALRDTVVFPKFVVPLFIGRPKSIKAIARAFENNGLVVFVTQKDFDWAKESVTAKKGLDCSRAELFTFEEGECVQIMHIGSYDDEPATIGLLRQFIEQNGGTTDIDNTNRFHHEIYLSDPRKTEASKCKTVIRYPVK